MPLVCIGLEEIPHRRCEFRTCTHNWLTTAATGKPCSSPPQQLARVSGRARNLGRLAARVVSGLGSSRGIPPWFSPGSELFLVTNGDDGVEAPESLVQDMVLLLQLDRRLQRTHHSSWSGAQSARRKCHRITDPHTKDVSCMRTPLEKPPPPQHD